MTESILSSNDLLNQHTKDFQLVIDNPQLEKLKDLSRNGYLVWLSQESYFLPNLIRLFANCLSKSNSKSALNTYSLGINLLKVELDSVLQQISEIKLNTQQAEVKKETNEYVKFLNNLLISDYQTLVIATWMICFLYFKVIEKNKISNIANDTIKNWKKIEFIELIDGLTVEVDNVLKTSKKDSNFDLKVLVPKIINFENGCWEMVFKEM